MVSDKVFFIPYNLNKFGRGPLVDVTYHISRLFALWFQKIFKVSFQKSILSQCNLDMQWTGPIAKFGQNPASILGDVLCGNCLWTVNDTVDIK